MGILFGAAPHTGNKFEIEVQWETEESIIMRANDARVRSWLMAIMNFKQQFYLKRAFRPFVICNILLYILFVLLIWAYLTSKKKILIFACV